MQTPETKERQNSGKRNRRRLGWTLALATVTFVAYSSCGDSEEFNLFQPIAEPLALNGDRAAMEEEAKVLMDEGDYQGAANLLAEMIGESALDSNRVRLLYAAAQLGVAELDVWSIVKTVLEARFEDGEDQRGGQSSGESGFDEFFDQLGETFLGTGTERTGKISALSSAIETLNDAPDPGDTKVRNTACLLAGMLAIPTLIDAQEGLEETLDALNTIKDSALSGGSECPDISLLDTASSTVTTAAANFTLALNAAANCPFLDLSETEALMNDVEAQLNLLLENTDKGCSEIPQCPSGLPNCAELFPSCVQEALQIGGENTAEAGDGMIAQCELVLHCTDPTLCFQ